MGSQAIIIVRFGRRSVELGPANPRAVIGRDPSTCDLPVALPAVSRRHAEIALLGAEPHLRDLGSANGTWVDGVPVGTDWVKLTPNQRVHLGENPLEVQWAGGLGSTTMELASPSLIQRIGEHQVAHDKAAEEPPAVGNQTVNLSFISELPYRWEGETAHGRLLLSLPGGNFQSDSPVQGAATFVAFDEAKVSSILVELLEISPGTGSRGRVWDRAIVMEGPFRADVNQRVTSTFRLELPVLSTPSGPKVSWQVRGLVDINWAKDIKLKCPLTVSNPEFERLFEAWAAAGGILGPLMPEEPGARYRGSVSLSGRAREVARTGDIRFEVLLVGDDLRLAFISKRLLGSDRRADMHLPRKQLRAMHPTDLGLELIEGLLAMG